MWLIFGIGAIIFAIKNLHNFFSGYDCSKERFISMSLTSLTILSFYLNAASTAKNGDLAALQDVLPSASIALLICTIASIVLNSISLFMKRK